MFPEPGIYPSLTFAEYAGIDAINAGFLSTLSRRSPFHAKHDRDYPPGDTDALRVGRALHSYTLEPATFEQYWTVWQKADRRTKDGKAAWEAFEAARGTRDWIDSVEFADIQAMADSLRRQQCLNLICSGRAEVSIVWKDADTDVLCKRRLDYERTDGWNHFITDLKSSGDIQPSEFSRDIAKYGYALAAAFSIDGWKVLTGEDSIYNLLAIEKDYHVAKVWELGERTIAAGRQAYQQALEVTAKCMKDDDWPAYGSDPEMIDAPEWYLQLYGAGQYNMI